MTVDVCGGLAPRGHRWKTLIFMSLASLHNYHVSTPQRPLLFHFTSHIRSYFLTTLLLHCAIAAVLLCSCSSFCVVIQHFWLGEINIFQHTDPSTIPQPWVPLACMYHVIMTDTSVWDEQIIFTVT